MLDESSPSGDERIDVDLDDALLDQLVDHLVDLRTEDDGVHRKAFLETFLHPLPVHLHRDVVGRAQRQIVERVDDADRRDLTQHRLLEHADAFGGEERRDRHLVDPEQRRVGGVAHLHDELRTGVRGVRRLVTRLAAEEDQLDGAALEQRRRQHRLVAEVHHAFQLPRRVVQHIGVDAEVDVEVEHAAAACFAREPDQLELRDHFSSRRILDARERRSDRQVVPQQAAQMVRKERHPVDQRIRWIEITSSTTLLARALMAGRSQAGGISSTRVSSLDRFQSVAF